MRKTPRHILLASSDDISAFNIMSNGKLVEVGSWNVPYQTRLPYVARGPTGIELFGDQTKSARNHWRIFEEKWQEASDSGFDGRYP